MIVWIIVISVAVVLILLAGMVLLRKVHFDSIHRNLLDLEDKFGGKVIRGVLHGFDQHMNLLLDGSVEIFDDGKTSDLGSIVVRGDNVVIISPPPA